MLFSGATQMGKQDDLGKRNDIGFAGRGCKRFACQRSARRARVTPQREQNEATREPPPWRAALARNWATTGGALIVTRQTADLVPFQFDFEVLTDWRTLLFPLRLEVSRLSLRNHPSRLADCRRGQQENAEWIRRRMGHLLEGRDR